MRGGELLNSSNPEKLFPWPESECELIKPTSEKPLKVNFNFKRGLIKAKLKGTAGKISWDLHANMAMPKSQLYPQMFCLINNGLLKMVNDLETNYF